MTDHPAVSRADVESLLQPLAFARGPAMRNRFMLAPMTNQQSAEDGTLLDEELHWLAVRARGGFAHVVTCACHVAEEGKGFPGELGIFSERHVPGLNRIATVLRNAGAVSSVQLYHGGLRAITRDLVAPSAAPASGARALTATEAEATIEAFAAGAQRAQDAGFDGVQLHAAHGYLISQFLSPEYNRRTDDWGGSAEKRSRFLVEIVDRIRGRSRPDFQLHVRLSPERFGQDLGEVVALFERLVGEQQVDSIDLSLWDIRKRPEDPRFGGRQLLDWFTRIPRGSVRLGAAGRIIEPREAVAALAAGLDFVTLGKVAVLHPDYPDRVRSEPTFRPDWLPVTAARLRRAGLGERFITYLSSWTNFVADRAPPPELPRFDIGEYLEKGAGGT